MRQNRRRYLRNQLHRGRARTLAKRARSLIQAEQEEEARAVLQDVYSALDKAAVKGVIHKNKAARQKSRLMDLFNETFQQEA